MNERYRSFKVKSYSSGTFGRAISNVRNHHFVTDDVGGDEAGFRPAPESSVIYPSTRGRHLGSGFRRSDEFIATGSSMILTQAITL